MRHFVAFAGYGDRVHEDESGSVDRPHHMPGGRMVEEHVTRAAIEREVMDQRPYPRGAERVMNQGGAIY